MTRMLVLVALLCSGCVHLVIERYDHETMKDKHGIRFYRPAPYLWLADDGNGRCTPTVVYYPDPNEEFIMHVAPWDGAIGIGTVSMKPVLQDGWNLTAMESSIDTKVPETLTAIATLAKSVMAPTAKLGEEPSGEVRAGPTVLHPGLYPIKLERPKKETKEDGSISITPGGVTIGEPILAATQRCAMIGLPPASRPKSGDSEN